MQEEMKRYVISYYFKGSKWATEVYAHSFEEAQEKVKAMSQATVDGEIHLSVYIPENPLSKIAKLIKSLLRKFS
ncbi:TPA: hypothetical protein QB448_002252 [Pasteurella multocida]|nr:hypothetical protein [Pasteurella multocida]HDR1507656.1 hypothetical protein [Pasteurella multocida]